ARGVGEVALHPEDRLDAGLARRRVHRERAVHVAVVGDADCGLAVGRGRRDDVADARRAVEHRVLGVQMEMDERVVLHFVIATGLTRTGSAPVLPGCVVHALSTWAGEFSGENYTAVIRPKVAPDGPAVDRWQDAPGHDARGAGI